MQDSVLLKIGLPIAIAIIMCGIGLTLRGEDFQRIGRNPRPVAVGSRIAFVAHFLGRRLAYTYEVRELVPEQRLVMSTTEGPFPMETTYTWEPAPGGTRMTLRNRGEPSGFSRLVAPMMARAMRRANEKDLAKLKARLEGQPAST